MTRLSPTGSAIDLGDSIDDSWQGWGIPQYVKDANPGLVSVSDLPDYADQFATAETQGRGAIRELRLGLGV